MVKNIYLLEMQKDTDHTSKSEFLKKMTFFFSEENTNLNSFLLILTNLFSNFKEDFIYNIDESIGINIKNVEDQLFVDLWNDSINIRYNNTEFYFFIEEISLEEFRKIIENFFGGKYVFKIYTNENVIIKQQLLFNDLELTKFNQEDIYNRKNKYTSVIEKKGYNWFN